MSLHALLVAALLCALPSAARCQEEVHWAIAIHGGAGTIPKDMDPQVVAEYEAALRRALVLGKTMLAEGKPGLDVVVEVVALLEDAPQFNAGKGAVFTHEGTHELDAALMDGENLACGTISGVSTVKNPIRLARLVMERSRHVMFVGKGAEQFADEMQVERVEAEYFFTQKRYEQWQRALKNDSYGTPPAKEDKKGTVGCVVLDIHGNLAAATSTGGLTNKRFGRVGDVPIIGAGTYANNATCAISCTGHGEQFIRGTVAHDVSAMMEYGGKSLAEAAAEVIQRKLLPGAGGLIGVSADGELVFEFSSPGMFRGAADSQGLLNIAIWE